MATKRPLADSEPLLPAPKFFKVRAHSNPLAESVALDVPATPAEMDWSALYPRWMAPPGSAAVPSSCSRAPGPAAAAQTRRAWRSHVPRGAVTAGHVVL
jgi:hypothetical protein